MTVSPLLETSGKIKEAAPVGGCFRFWLGLGFFCFACPCRFRWSLLPEQQPMRAHHFS
ncbi:MAG: hypothetical protein LBG83_04790 [Oscillospiraceae bacterium]|nr:hypothetical protein [Oscillospiraceae bacterium]